jgi:hypothetical protein
VRFWDFELPGAWNVSSGIAAGLMVVSIIFQMNTLWRSLQLKDEQESEYNKTLRWFLASGVALLASLALAFLSFSHLIKF